MRQLSVVSCQLLRNESAVLKPLTFPYQRLCSTQWLLRFIDQAARTPMWQLAVKFAVTAAVVVAVSEIAKRSTLWGALLASLPLTSLLAFVWLYVETGDSQRIATLSQSIFWLVLASLPLFLMLPLLLRSGWRFWPSLVGVCLITSVLYLGLVWLLRRFHVPL